jgi:hypothetical protein
MVLTEMLGLGSRYVLIVLRIKLLYSSVRMPPPFGILFPPLFFFLQQRWDMGLIILGWGNISTCQQGREVKNRPTDYRDLLWGHCPARYTGKSKMAAERDLGN